MLQFIIGRASSGKTYTVTEKIAECVDMGVSPILLVPEQFSFESEKLVLKRLGDSDAQKVSVLSFSRLCDEVECANGGICGHTLTDADKVILMNKALSHCKDELLRWGRYASSSGFSRLMIDTISEFKLNAISPDDLRMAAEQTDNTVLKLKLLDTALIYEEYNAVISEKFIDPLDRLTKLYNTLKNYKFFEGKTVFLDSFEGFTGQQYKIIDCILSDAACVIVSLADNVNDNRPFSLFLNVRRTKQRIKSLADSHGVQIANDIILNHSHYTSNELLALEEFISTNKIDFTGSAEDITVCACENIYSEAEFVARNIRRIVRETGASYSDFAIIARDTAPYEDALATACKKNKIGCFIDRRLPLSTLPPTVAVLSVLELTKGFTTEKILRFYKSGINAVAFEDIVTLENYTYLWGIDGNSWLTVWEMNPSGFAACESGMSSDEQAQLDKINSVREQMISPIVDFCHKFKGNASQMACAVVELFKGLDAGKKFTELSAQYRKSGDFAFADGMLQAWSKIVQILDSIVMCYGEVPITQKEFYDAFLMSVSLDTVGVIPQMVDEAIFGAADRIRPSRPEYVFIMGANSGVFPATAHNSGLFADNEREKLIELGIDIPDKTISYAIDEEFLLYSNICCASKGVFISYNNASDDSSFGEPSAFVGEIVKHFKCRFLSEPTTLSPESLPETAEDAFSQLCRSVSKHSEDIATIKAALDGVQGMSDRIDTVMQSASRPVFSISPDTALQLFGNKIKMSPTRFDTFNRCKFMFFCRYGLGAQRLQPAEFNAMQRGTLIHYVLQRVIEDYGNNFRSMVGEQVSQIVDELIAQYLGSIQGYKSVETPHLKYLVSTMSRTLKYVVERLVQEFAQSEFKPVKCELKIGNGGDIPEIKIPVCQYGELALTGVVDRLDSWNGYIRIIDYKTGTREFKLPDILFGQNMQMLIYLYALMQSKKYGEKPAGILYMHAARAKNATPSARRMNGLLTCDECLITAMDKENKGEYVPRLNTTSVSDSFISSEDFNKVFDYIERKLKASGRAIFEGRVAANPIDGIDSPACAYCEFASVCRIEKEKIMSVPKLSNAQVISEIDRQVKSNEL